MPARRPLEPLPAVLKAMTKGFDSSIFFDVSSNSALPTDWIFGFFHIGLKTPAAKLVDHVLSVSSDQDRLHFAEQFAQSVLDLTDQTDQKWFRQGVWVKETVPTTHYPEQRDHAVHTLHNYLLGWYFFAGCPAVRHQLINSFKARRIENGSTSVGAIQAFGGLWCFTGLLHDIGYMFEGEVPTRSMTLLDDGIRDGARWANEYFEEVFWNEMAIRNVDERRTVERLTQFAPFTLHEGGAGTVAQFLRDLGSLDILARIHRITR